MKIALAQINTTIGDFETIARKAKENIDAAKSAGASLILFPELTTTGYPPRDLLEMSDFIDKSGECLRLIASYAKGIDVIVGCVERNKRPGGKALFNAAAWCHEGKVVQTYHKKLLPTYDVFDEGRHFEPGKETVLWSIGGKRVGVSICEDAWNDKLFWEKRLYPHDPIEEIVHKGADLIVNISASPFSVEKTQLRRDILEAIALKHGVPCLYVNMVGGNDELVFDGRSLAVNASGRIVAEAKGFEEDFLIVDTEKMKSVPADISPKKDDRMESVFHALTLGLRDYVVKCGFRKVILGLSGGIDSTLTAVIACEALGPENVLGVMMPSMYSSEGSVSDAEALARGLKIETRKIAIKSVYDSYRQLFGRQGDAPDLADENTQARIRGNILMTLSNRDGYLVLTTGNKSEMAVGYCTLYGDMSGGLAVISDVPKTMVYELSRWYQRKNPVIPESCFTKPPSAELRPDQTDQDSLPPYDILDAILKAYIEDLKSPQEIIDSGFDAKTVEDVVKKVKWNEYKRRQAAPGLKISSKAFGMGRRLPIARKM